MKNLNLFITGSSGFVGKNLTEYFGDKYTLFTPSHSELELLDEHAVSDYIKKNDIDLIIHCANVGATRKTDKFPQIVGNNLRMFLNLARHSIQLKKMIFFGSGAEFNKSDNLAKVTEDYQSQSLPSSDYGLSKYLCSHFINHYDNIINLRMFGVYGKHDDYENRFVSNAVCRAVLGLPIIIYQNAVIDFIFVDDLLKIVEHFVNNNSDQKFYNIGTGNPFSILEIAELIKKISGKNIDIIVKEPGLAPEYTCNISRLASEIDDFKFTSMEKSLSEMYKWYNENKACISVEKFEI
ncbi:MAG: NAD(P)-dependent oxidoreductase [Candidatus Doudnabacteria bacterium]|nr:NAD(P)-dependent oxidoreductase [Candidatus Doudnabacteria bacterium]